MTRKTTPAPAFNEIIHAPLRLRVCAMLAGVESVEFGTLRDELAVADSVLSKHLKVLSEAGFVTLTKPQGNGRVKTWVKATKQGRLALAGHLAALQEIADSATLPR